MHDITFTPSGGFAYIQWVMTVSYNAATVTTTVSNEFTQGLTWSYTVANVIDFLVQFSVADVGNSVVQRNFVIQAKLLMVIHI